MSLPMPEEQGPMMGASGATAPAAVKPDMGGMTVRGAIMADLGIKALSQAIALVGATTPQGIALIEGLKTITKAFPAPPSADLTASEVKLLAARANPAPMGTPGPGAQAALSNLTSGAAPPAAPGVAA